MHILLLGASGRNGSLILQSALKRGYTVTALVRNPSVFTESSPSLTLVTGSSISQPDLEVALQSPTPPDAVIFALGHRKAGISPFASTAPDCPLDLMESSTKALLNAIRATNLAKQPKLIVNSSQGVGTSMASLSAPMRFVINYIVRPFEQAWTITPMWMPLCERVVCRSSLLDHLVSPKGLLPPFALGLMMDVVLRDGLPLCLGPAWQSG